MINKYEIWENRQENLQYFWEVLLEEWSCVSDMENAVEEAGFRGPWMKNLDLDLLSVRWHRQLQFRLTYIYEGEHLGMSQNPGEKMSRPWALAVLKIQMARTGGVIIVTAIVKKSKWLSELDFI